MINFPIDAIQFQNQFGTDAQCEAAIAKLRWPNGFRCPNCGHDDGYKISTRRQIQCCVCRHQASITSGTIFHRTHLPLTCWFWIIYQIAQDKGGASATRLASQLNRPYKTIWFVLQKLRYAMGARDAGISLAGLIEMDEAVLGPECRRPAKQDGKIVRYCVEENAQKKPWGLVARDGRKRKEVMEVFILVEAERFHAGNVVMKMMPNKTYYAIRDVIEQRVDEDQWFRTDAHSTHWVLRTLSRNFKIVKSSEAVECEALPVLHRVIALLKHFLMGTYFGVSTKYLPGYLNEFCFRFMRREKEQSLYVSLLRACVFALPYSCAELKL